MLQPTVPNSPGPARCSCTQAMTLATRLLAAGIPDAAAEVRVNQPQTRSKPGSQRTMTVPASEFRSIASARGCR